MISNINVTHDNSKENVPVLQLHHFPLCPISRLIRVILKENGISAYLVEEVFGINLAIMEINPFGRVPFIVLKDGSVLKGLWALLDYLIHYNKDQQTTMPSFLSIAERGDVYFNIQWFCEKFFSDVVEPIINEKIVNRYMSKHNSMIPNSTSIRNAIKNMSIYMEYLKISLNENLYVIGCTPTIADYAIATQLSVLDYTNDINWNSTHKKIRAWYSLIKSRPSFRDLLKDRIYSISPPEHYENPDF